ncbi:MAG: ABC transporter ATP-binding protein [Treponemataceae bacterium]
MLYELTNVALRYGKNMALEISSMNIRKGELVALLGPNGSGKTSLLKLMDGLVAPSEGRVRREGKIVTKISSESPKSVYLHQFPYLFCGSVAYNVAFGCRALHLNAKETRKRSEEAIALLGLEKIAGRKYARLSGGEAQRVALARALATKADILLLDEPSASADTASIALIAATLRACADEGKTIVFSTHDEEFARNLSTRRIRLHAGKITDDSGETL